MHLQSFEPVGQRFAFARPTRKLANALRRSTTPGATYFFTVMTYQPGRSGTGRARHAPSTPINPSGNATLLPDLLGNWPMRYRRSTTPGATYFFTVMTYQPGRSGTGRARHVPPIL
ncbi:MAG: hypothetical protein H6973_03190 [Gammaproteobacteria bacterium]|nr:hypothetical protein [Gammaproteobacteria bacterium]HRX72340.1 hypothetical protein [Candidatus Competibacteraceae bacterium]